MLIKLKKKLKHRSETKLEDPKGCKFCLTGTQRDKNKNPFLLFTVAQRIKTLSESLRASPGLFRAAVNRLCTASPVFNLGDCGVGGLP